MPPKLAALALLQRSLGLKCRVQLFGARQLPSRSQLSPLNLILSRAHTSSGTGPSRLEHCPSFDL